MRRTVLVGVSAWLLLVGVAGPAGALTGVTDDAGALVDETAEALGETVEATVDETLSESTDVVRRLVEGTVGQPPPDPGDGLDGMPLPSWSGDDAEPPTVSPPSQPDGAGGEPAPSPANRTDSEADEPLAALPIDGPAGEDEAASADLSGLAPLPHSDVRLSPLEAPFWLIATAVILSVAVGLGHALSGLHGLRQA